MGSRIQNHRNGIVTLAPHLLRSGGRWPNCRPTATRGSLNGSSAPRAAACRRSATGANRCGRGNCC